MSEPKVATRCAWAECERPPETVVRPPESRSPAELPVCAFHEQGGYFGDGTAWGEFELLQRDFLDVIAVMPLVEDALEWWSFRLADVLRRCGAAADSFLQEWSRAPGYLVPAKKNVRIVDRFDQVRPHSEWLTYREVYVRALGRAIRPWEGWSASSTPAWWAAHNKVKHDAWGHMRLGTLAHALHGLAAVFALHVENPYARAYLSPDATRQLLDAGPVREPMVVRTLAPPITTPLGTPHYLFRSAL